MEITAAPCGSQRAKSGRWDWWNSTASAYPPGLLPSLGFATGPVYLSGNVFYWGLTDTTGQPVSEVSAGRDSAHLRAC